MSDDPGVGREALSDFLTLIQEIDTEFLSEERRVTEASVSTVTLFSERCCAAARRSSGSSANSSIKW